MVPSGPLLGTWAPRTWGSWGALRAGFLLGEVVLEYTHTLALPSELLIPECCPLYPLPSGAAADWEGLTEVLVACRGAPRTT